jgi:hypothetical protein
MVQCFSSASAIDSGTKSTLNKLYRAISKQENAHPEAALLVACNFNGVKLIFISISSVQLEVTKL